jgi:hypothetical protein
LKRRPAPGSSASNFIHEETVPKSVPAVLKRTKRLTLEERGAAFDELFDYVSQRIGKRPSTHLPMRHSAWNILISLAASEQQLDSIANIFPKWKEGGHKLRPSASDIFIRMLL